MSILSSFKRNLTEDVLSDLHNISTTNKTHKINLSDGSIDVDSTTANMLITAFQKLNDEKRKKFLELLSKSTETFMKLVNFGWKNN